jgi:hypothetical protein
MINNNKHPNGIRRKTMLKMMILNEKKNIQYLFSCAIPVPIGESCDMLDGL